MAGFGLDLTTQRSSVWWPQGAVYAADFVNDRYMINGVAVPASAAYQVTRATSKFAETAPGRWTQFAPNTPARGYRGLSLEPAATYEPLNAAMLGAVAGVIGSGGVRPTGWPSGAMAGLNAEIIGVGTDGDMPYLRLRLFGTTTSTDLQWMFDNSTVGAATGQTWTAGLMLRHVAGSTAGITPSLRIVEQESATFLTASQTDFTWSPTFDWKTVTRTFDQPTTNRARIRLRLLANSGQAIDITLDLAAQSLSQSQHSAGPWASQHIQENRALDAATLSIPTSGDMQLVWHDQAATLNSTSGGLYSVPASPSARILSAAYLL